MPWVDAHPLLPELRSLLLKGAVLLGNDQRGHRLERVRVLIPGLRSPRTGPVAGGHGLLLQILT